MMISEEKNGMNTIKDFSFSLIAESIKKLWKEFKQNGR